MAFIQGGPTMIFVSQFLMLAHGFTTAGEFFIVECIARRYGTRDIFGVFALWVKFPVL